MTEREEESPSMSQMRGLRSEKGAPSCGVAGSQFQRIRAVMIRMA